VFDLACPGLLGTLTTFRKMYEGPIQRGRDADSTEKQVCCPGSLLILKMHAIATCHQYWLV